MGSGARPTLTKSQKNIFIMGFGVGIFILLFWLIVYYPAENKMKRLKQNFAAIRKEIKKIEMVSGGEGTLDKAYEKFYKRVAELEEKYAVNPGAVISILSSEADKMDVEVLGVKPEGVRRSGLVSDISGKVLSEVPISMNIRCGYIKLGEYLDMIETREDVFLSVDRIDVRRSRTDDEKVLDIVIDLTLYMLTG